MVSTVVVDHATRTAGALGTLVLVNSLGTTLAMWDDVAAIVRGDMDVVRFDLRGHGSAESARAATDLDDFADDLFDVLDRLGVEAAHVAGISLGGMVAIRAAARRPERIGSLAVLCCAAVYEPQGWRERAGLVREHGLEPIVPIVMQRWFGRGFRHQRPGAVAAYADMLRAIPPRGYAEGCEVLATADVRPDLARVSARTLVLGGADDPATPPQCQRVIADAIPGARLVVLPAVAHLAPVAAPTEVAEWLIAHALDRVRP